LLRCPAAAAVINGDDNDNGLLISRTPSINVSVNKNENGN